MKNKLNKKNSHIPMKTIICQFITIALQLLMTGISAAIISRSDFSSEKLSIFWFIIIPLSSLIGGFITARIHKNKGFLWGAMTGTINSLIAFIVNFINCNMSVELSLCFLIPAGIFSGLVGGIISSNLK